MEDMQYGNYPSNSLKDGTEQFEKLEQSGLKLLKESYFSKEECSLSPI